MVAIGPSISVASWAKAGDAADARATSAHRLSNRSCTINPPEQGTQVRKSPRRHGAVPQATMFQVAIIA
jgi:hypothetical protein